MPERSFSLKIEAYGFNQALLTKYFCLYKITEFSLHTSSQERWRQTPVDYHDETEDINFNIFQLTALLEDMVNLRKFYWRCGRYRRNRGSVWPPILELSEYLGGLQKVFLGLKHLHFLALDGFVFHPHFFLRPPESVRELRILWAMGQTWWKQFSEFPFVGLQRLFIHVETVQRHELVEEEWSDRSFDLGSVSVRGLQSFKIFGQSMLPIDLEDRIIQNNPGLDEDSVRHFWQRRGAAAASKCFRKLEDRAVTAARILWSSLPGEFSTGNDNPASLDLKAVKEYSQTFTSAGELPNISMEGDIWKDIEANVQRELMARVRLCAKYTSCQYSLGASRAHTGQSYNHTQVYPDAQNRARLEAEFLDDCVSNMLEFSDLLSQQSFGPDLENWVSTESNTKQIAHRSLDTMRRLLWRVVPLWAIRFGDSFRKGRDVDIESTIKRWIPTLAEIYEASQGGRNRISHSNPDAQRPPSGSTKREEIIHKLSSSEFDWSGYTNLKRP
ncbi:hypothetical protein TWF506_004369 [Arthrobotrys conoides]|uniref:Uncharacterized protein n=1 Tax=Arthrobotrys conoides TaxID=74498 RepID=A0AAN8RIB2_9PEZI